MSIARAKGLMTIITSLIDLRHCLKHLKPTEDYRFHNLLLRVLFSPEKSYCPNVSEFRAQCFQTKASPLLMASRYKHSTSIILSVICFCMAQFH